MQRTRRRWAGLAAVVRMGVSVKLADIYPSTIAYQWIDVTEVPDGTYRLKGEDPDRRPPGQVLSRSARP